MGKKLRGRPQLESGKRSKRIDTRFTEAEYELIEEMERTLGVCRTDLIRQRLLHKGKAQVIHAAELIRQLDTVGAELARAGNNINQLARHANRLQLMGSLSPDVAAAFNGLMDDYNRRQDALERVLRQIIRALLQR